MRRDRLARIYIYKYKENSKVEMEIKKQKGFGVLSWRRSERGPGGDVKGWRLE